MPRGSRRHTWVVLVAGLAFPATAWGQVPGDKAAAQALFDEAIKLIGSRSYGEACPKLEESERLDPAMGTRFQLAQCYEAVGRTASAWAGFLELADLARAAGQEAREKTARQRAADLEPAVNRLVIDVEAPTVAELEVQRDGKVLGAAQWGSAIPVDPGVHHVSATAPSKAPWFSDVTVAGAGRTVRVHVPSLADAAPPLAGARPPMSEPVAPPPSPPARDASMRREEPRGVDASRGGSRRALGFVTMGAGVLGLGAGVALGLAARSEYDGVGGHCSPAGCDAQGKSTTDSARQLGDIGTAAFVAGTVLAVGGFVLWLTAPSGRALAPSSASASRLPPLSLGFGPRGLRIDGSF